MAECSRRARFVSVVFRVNTVLPIFPLYLHMILSILGRDGFLCGHKLTLKQRSEIAIYDGAKKTVAHFQPLEPESPFPLRPPRIPPKTTNRGTVEFISLNTPPGERTQGVDSQKTNQQPPARVPSESHVQQYLSRLTKKICATLYSAVRKVLPFSDPPDPRPLLTAVLALIIKSINLRYARVVYCPRHHIPPIWSQTLYYILLVSSTVGHALAASTATLSEEER